MWKKQSNKKKENTSRVREKSGKKLSLKRQKRYKKFIGISAILLFSIVIVSMGRYFFANLILRLEDSIWAFGVGTNNGFPCEIKGDKVPSNDMVILNDNIAVLSDKFFESFNLFGQRISCRVHNLSNPMMRTSDSGALLYDIGGNNYSIESCSKNILKGDLKYKIICGDISENGIYGFITDSTSYLSCMTILNTKKIEKYKYNFSDFYVCGMAMKPDGNGVAVCGSLCEKGEINSYIYIFNFEKKEPLLKYEFPNETIVSLHYLSNRNLVAIGNKSLIFIDIKKNNKKDISYAPKLLKCTSIEKNNGLVCCWSSLCEDKEARLVSIDKDGNIRFEIHLEGAVDKISADKNKILCIQDKNILVYDNSGKFKNKIGLANNSTGILKLSSSSVAVLENKTLEKVNIS